jgi:serine/threonine-protein kinase HipA
VTSQLIKHQVQIAIGAKAAPLGQLTFVRDGRREYSGFSYGQEWLHSPERFEISPDLPLRDDFFTRRAPSNADSPFHFALADTAPDAWGRRIVQRAHAKRRAADPTLAQLTAFDYLASVDDFSRIGALRLIDTKGQFLGSSNRYRTPMLIDLSKIASSIRKVEKGTEDAADLEYLQGKATSLGGLRPKCSLLDENGELAIGKFPSVSDERSIVRAEVLALRLVAYAGSVACTARAVTIDKADIAIIHRFDRTSAGARIPYLSGGSLLQARRDEDRSYTELADAIRRIGAAPIDDLRELWRRLVINLLITNVDVHLWNVGFLYAGDGKWRLAPAFDVNPFPDKDRESKTWLSESSGPITSIEQVLAESSYFGFTRPQAEAAAGSIAVKLADWKQLGSSREIGLSEQDLIQLTPAFEHQDAQAARALAR